MMPVSGSTAGPPHSARSEEHTSESSHGYISYAVFCLKKKKKLKSTQLPALQRTLGTPWYAAPTSSASYGSNTVLVCVSTLTLSPSLQRLIASYSSLGA